MNDPVRVISKIKNNRLLSLWEDSGLKLSDFVAKLGISLNMWYHLVSLKKYPSEITARKLAEATGMGIDELFPGFLKKITKTVAVRTIPEHELVALAEVDEAKLITSGDQEENLFQGEMKDALRSAINTLNTRTEIVLKMRYGIDGPECTLDEIAARFNITRERVRQIETRGLRQLRHPSRSNMLHEFVDPNKCKEYTGSKWDADEPWRYKEVEG
jgi:RNA polymerase sigma factor (sigma-70 family)